MAARRATGALSAHELFPAGDATDTAMIARVPFDSGSLVGHWTEETYSSWEPGSVPHTLFRGDRFGETLRRTNELKTICTEYYPTLAEAAMRYALSSPQVKTVIPGMRTTANVDKNVAYSDGAEFPAELLEKIAPFNWPRQAIRPLRKRPTTSPSRPMNRLSSITARPFSAELPSPMSSWKKSSGTT